MLLGIQEGFLKGLRECKEKVMKEGLKFMNIYY